VLSDGLVSSESDLVFSATNGDAAALGEPWQRIRRRIDIEGERRRQRGSPGSIAPCDEMPAIAQVPPLAAVDHKGQAGRWLVRSRPTP